VTVERPVDDPFRHSEKTEIPAGGSGNPGAGAFQDSGVYMQNTKNVFLGVLIGGLAGAATILLVAAQSIIRTRATIPPGIHWPDRAAGVAKYSPAPAGNAAGGRTAGNMTVHIA
jgi:hypothetical protein